jgi:hypothetical protein
MEQAQAVRIALMVPIAEKALVQIPLSVLLLDMLVPQAQPSPKPVIKELNKRVEIQMQLQRPVLHVLMAISVTVLALPRVQ